MTAFLVPQRPLSVTRMRGFSRLLAALDPVLSRVLVVDRGGGSQVTPSPISGFQVVAADESEPIERIVRSRLETEAPPSTVVLIAGEGLSSWSDEEIARVDCYAARVVAITGGWAASQADSGAVDEVGLDRDLVLFHRRRSFELDRLLRGTAGHGELTEAPFDFSALRRLRDLDLAPGEIRIELVTALSRRRKLLARLTAKLGLPMRPELAFDRVEVDPTVLAGEPVRLLIEGWIVELPPVRHLVVRVGDRRYAVAVDRSRPDVVERTPFLPDVRCGFRFVRRIEGLGPGTHSVAIERRDGRLLRRVGAVRVGRITAVRARSSTLELSLQRCAVVVGSSGSQIEIEGTLIGSAPIDALRVEADGRFLFDVDRRHFVAEPGASDPERWRFCTIQSCAFSPGRHSLRVTARRGQVAVAEWSGEIEVAVAVDARREIVSQDLDRLARDLPATIWGPLRLNGQIVGAREDDVIELWKDGEMVARSRPGDEGRFSIRHVPESEDEAVIDLRSAAGDGDSLRSRTAVIRARPLTPPAGWPDAIATIVNGAGAQGLIELPPGDLAARLAEIAGPGIGALDRSLRQLALRVESVRRIVERPDSDFVEPGRRRLKVLFASWEIPWSGHGGGVHLVQLLKHLGVRHDITLIHPVFPGAEGLSEEVREYCHEILTPQRGWQPPGGPRPFGVPERLLWTWSAELTRAIAAEVASGAYDLINCEGSELLLHFEMEGSCPAVVAALEYSSFAEVSAAPPGYSEIEEAAQSLYRLVQALHYESILLADRFERLITLTDPEADLLSAFVPRGQLAVNPIAVDVHRLSRASLRSNRRESATFVFVGAYRHAPNLRAAEELIDRIVPAIRTRLSGSRMLLVGADLPADLVDRAAAAGVETPGWIDDLPALLGGSTAFLAPIHTGAGMRVKLLEAMACGCPIVTTALGMSGIAARDGEEYLRATTAEEFAEAALRLADRPEERERLVTGARRLVARDHGIPVQGERRERIWAALLEQHSAGE